MSANLVQPFGQLYLTCVHIYMSEELYYTDVTYSGTVSSPSNAHQKPPEFDLNLRPGVQISNRSVQNFFHISKWRLKLAVLFLLTLFQLTSPLTKIDTGGGGCHKDLLFPFWYNNSWDVLYLRVWVKQSIQAVIVLENSFTSSLNNTTCELGLCL